jgi:hypothetical protein
MDKRQFNQGCHQGRSRDKTTQYAQNAAYPVPVVTEPLRNGYIKAGADPDGQACAPWMKLVMLGEPI